MDGDKEAIDSGNEDGDDDFKEVDQDDIDEDVESLVSEHEQQGKQISKCPREEEEEKKEKIVKTSPS